MIRLVNDLLQLSKMDNESDQITKEIVDFNMYINKIINRHEMAAKDTTFVREIPQQTIFTEIDPDKMTQVFDNVITNAMKYSRGDKRVEFHVKQNALYNRMTIRIKDNGIGIPINKVDKIFDRFYRVDKARTRKMGGTGLGLAISKEIVEAHNGRIWANSVEGQGTSIFITLVKSLKTVIGMNSKEHIKSIILGLLVLISIVLTYLVWNYTPDLNNVTNSDSSKRTSRNL